MVRIPNQVSFVLSEQGKKLSDEIRKKTRYSTRVIYLKGMEMLNADSETN